MPKSAEQNGRLREERRARILDAALTVYLSAGYHGADMDAVAAEARLAKGLLYYYFKTKRALFQALFDDMFEKGGELSDSLLERSAGMPPVRRLVYYTAGMFEANGRDARMMRFFVRAPFDAVAVFGRERWQSGADISRAHTGALEAMIREGVALGEMDAEDPAEAANSLWTVFAAHLFLYPRLMLGEEQAFRAENSYARAMAFGMRGLGVSGGDWLRYVALTDSEEEWEDE